MKLLCPSSQLVEAQSRAFSLGDLQLLAVRRHGQVYLYRNRCPHRNIPLHWESDRFLDDSASLIQCASHGALFLIESGECVVGPCEGQFLSAVPCREDSQGIWVLPG